MSVIGCADVGGEVSGSAQFASRPVPVSIAEVGFPRRSWSWRALVAYAVISVVVGAVVAFNVLQPIKVLPRARLAPGFSMINQRGERRTSEDYRGAFTIYGFTAVGCGAGCTDTLAEMQRLRGRLSTLADQRYALVSIVLDTDDPASRAAIAARTARYEANQASATTWDILSTDSVTTKLIVGGGFGVYYERARTPGNTTIGAVRFDPRYVLVDGWGIVRAEYRSTPLDGERVMRDLEFLASEVRHSSGIGRFAYEAAHLFRCYP